MKKIGKIQAVAMLITVAALLGSCGINEQPTERGEEGAGLSSAGEASEEGMIQPEKSVVLVKSGNAVGSGVLRGVSEDGTQVVILTAGHVLDNLAADDSPRVIFGEEKEVSCDSYVRSDTIDAAVLFIRDAKLAEQLRQEDCFEKEDRERFDNLKDGDSCIAIGGGDGEEKDACTGEILDNWIYMEDYAQYMIWADAQIHPGMSGGGLFDSEGYFLGILSGGSEDGQLAAVPLSLILSEFHNFLD